MTDQQPSALDAISHRGVTVTLLNPETAEPIEYRLRYRYTELDTIERTYGSWENLLDGVDRTPFQWIARMVKLGLAHTRLPDAALDDMLDEERFGEYKDAVESALERTVGRLMTAGDAEAASPEAGAPATGA